MIKDVRNMSVKKVFDTSESNNKVLIYQIPSYQREYSWKKENWEDLFDDIFNNDKNYFLGTIICIVQEDNNFVINEVIDGQQRLTTLSILLSALYNQLNQLIDNFSKKKTEMRHFIELSDSIYLESNHQTRLTLSIQKKNKEDYAYLVNKLFGNESNEPLQYDKRKIYGAYKYFSDRLSEIVSKQSIDNVVKIYMELLDKINSVSMIKIDVEDANSAFTLFESINYRGMSLTPVDLIKNELIKECERQEVSEPNQTNKEWQKIIQYIPNASKQVRFLRHFCYAFSNEIEQEFKGAIRGPITESNLVKNYQLMINNNAGFILKKLTGLAHIYGFILGETLEGIALKNHEKLFNSLKSLNEIQFVPANSLLLYLFNKFPNENYESLLDFLGVWFLCRHLTDIPSSKKLDDIFQECISITEENKKYDFILIKNYLNKYIDRDEVLKFFTNEEFYTKGSNKKVQYFLMRLESNRRFKEDAMDKNQNWTIEHIYPRKPAKNSDWGLYFKDADNKWLNHLGNLTLTCFNSSLSNKSFREKYVATNNQGNKIGYESGNIKINQSLIGKTSWTPKDIQERSMELANEFLTLLDI